MKAGGGVLMILQRGKELILQNECYNSFQLRWSVYYLVNVKLSVLFIDHTL
jgi:hypothetical protein